MHALIDRTAGRGCPIMLLALAWLLLGAGCSQGRAPAESWRHAPAGVFDAALSGDGRYAALSAIAAGAGLWDLRRGERLYKWRHSEDGPDNIARVAVSPDGSRALTADERTYVLWSTRSGEGLGYWQVDADITAVALAERGRHVLLGLQDGRALHIELASGRRLEVIAHGGEPVTAAALSAAGRRAATAGGDGRAVVWDSGSGRELAVHAHDARVPVVALSAGGERLFSADNRGTALVSVIGAGAPVALALPARQYVVSAARFSAGGRRLLTGFPGGGVSLWDAATGEALARYGAAGRGWRPRGNVIHAVAFGGDGRSVVAEGSNGSGHRWPL